MDRHESIVGQFEHDHLQQVSGSVGSDDEDLGRIGVGIDVDHDERTASGMRDVLIGDAVPPSRSVDVHTLLM